MAFKDNILLKKKFGQHFLTQHWIVDGKGDVCIFLIFNNSSSFSIIWLQNLVPLSDTISRGKPCLHNHLEKSAEATVVALLSGMATSSAYFENASVTHNMNFFPEEVVFNGPNKSM